MFKANVKYSLYVLIQLGSILFSESVLASPADIAIPGFAVSAQYESVNNSVAYAPNIGGGELADPQSRPRFQSHGFELSYTADRRTRYELGVTERQLTSLRDSFVIDELSFGLQHALGRRSHTSRFSLDVGFNARVNRASEIYKNSYTAIADQLITEVRLQEPRDARLTVHADLGVALSSRLHMNVQLSGGVSQTRQKRVVGMARLDNDCQYNFSASGEGGSINQLGRCDNLISFSRVFPNDKAIDGELGFSVNNDITYRDYFLGPIISMHWRAGIWALDSGVSFRQYFRPKLDDRIRDAGGTPVTRSQSAFAGAGVEILRHWKLDARVRYERAAFLDDIPFLYTALTHKRFNGDGVIRYALSVTRYFD